MSPQVSEAPACTKVNASETLNGALTAVAGPLVACSVYPLPGLSITRLLKLATPLAALAVTVPESLEPGAGQGALATLRVTEPVGNRFPAASLSVTCTAGDIVVLPGALLGWTVNTSCDAKAADTVKLAPPGTPRPSADIVAAPPRPETPVASPV